MIRVDYQGQTGNQLMQYSYCRLLADYLKQGFCADKIAMFPELKAPIGYDTSKDGTITIQQTSRHDQVLTFDRVARMTEGFDVILRGYFEVGSLYYPYASIIRSWFNPAEPLLDGVAVHVRGGDGEHNSPPASYYAEALGAAEIGESDPFIIITDDPDCKVVKDLKIFNCTVKNQTPAEDFALLRRHIRIIIGNSTFAWWAAFLSNAVQVIQPEPLHGFRSAEVPNSYLKVQAWQQITY